jgi:ribosomal protein L32E
LEKNLVQHKTNERIMRYKLEVYEKKNSFHLWQSNKYRGIAPRWRDKSRANGITQKKEIQIKESQDLKRGTTQEEVHPKIPYDLKGKGQEEKN